MAKRRRKKGKIKKDLIQITVQYLQKESIL